MRRIRKQIQSQSQDSDWAAPCERKCRFWMVCVLQCKACQSFENWVTWGDELNPPKVPPTKTAYDRIFSLKYLRAEN